ncbi:radical SAM protein [Candidatus Parcubacteria bacterium]|nr:radical SAM protein [Candidatus Parcubacteria bacterium]
MRNKPNKIKRLVIKIIDTCQHNCIYCVNNDSISVTGKMSLKMIEDIIKKFLPEEVEFTGGEVALDYEHILSAVRISSKYSKFIMLNTNMELWNRQKFINLERSGLTHIHLALNTLDKKLHKIIRGNTESDINRVLRNLNLLLRHTKITVQFEFVMMKINLNEFNAVYSYINSIRKRYGARIECLEAQRLILNGRAKISMKLSSEEELIMLKNNIVLDCPIIIFCCGEISKELSRFKYKIHKCGVGLNVFYINTKGKVFVDNYSGYSVAENYNKFDINHWLSNNKFFCPFAYK